MRILTINYEYPPLGGGGGVIHQYLAEELAKRHDVAAITTAFESLPLRETVNGVDVHRLKVLGRRSLATASVVSMLSFHWSCLRRGQKIIDEFRPDLINTHFAVPTGPSAVRLARSNGLPHALCIHGEDIYDPSRRLSPHRVPGLSRVVRNVLNRSDLVIAQSQNTDENARRFHGYERPLTIIPHGIPRPDLPRFDRQQLGFEQDDVILINVGRLVARKANRELIQMFARLNHPRSRLVLIGDGPEMKMLQALVDELGISQQVTLTGFVDETRKLQLLQAADAFVSTTHHEGFGLMFLEAMFCGLPILTYDHGGHADFLVDRETGFVVPLMDEDQFSARMDAMLQDQEMRQRMSRFNVELAQRYAIENCAAQYEDAFEQLLSARKPGRGETNGAKLNDTHPSS